MIHYDRVWAEIDLDAIIKNMESIKSRIDKNAQVVAVIKTDGYGHGAAQIARVLEPDEQVWGCSSNRRRSLFFKRTCNQKTNSDIGLYFPIQL